MVLPLNRPKLVRTVHAMKVNLLILQPQGYIHSLCFLDTARYLRHHLRSHGVQAHISKNRPMAGVLNIIFGAHLGMPIEWIEDFHCIIFNQEQLGAGGADLPAEYMHLLRKANTIDYDLANMAVYASGSGSIAEGPVRILLPLRHAPHLEPLGAGLPIQKRPIDLLFFGSLNPERIALIRRIEQSGIEVSRFDHPMYGPERDEYIAQSKAILNIPFYGANRFEQVRVFNALSIGTPVVSLRRAGLCVDPAYEDTVHWFDESHLEGCFGQYFGSSDWLRKSEFQIAKWRTHVADESTSDLVSTLKRLHAQRSAGSPQVPHRGPIRLNLNSGMHWRPGWINTTANPEVPDVSHTRTEDVVVPPELVDELHASHELESHASLQRLLNRALGLMKNGASMSLDCPLGVYGAESKELKTLQQQALGTIRFALDNLIGTTEQYTLQLEDVRAIQESTASGQGDRHSIRFVMRQRLLTPRELVAARCRRLDFGRFPEDKSEGSRIAMQVPEETGALMMSSP
jgi:hypothetical protein